MKEQVKKMTDVADGTFERLKKRVMKQLKNINEEEVVPQASFVNDLGADDLDLVWLIMDFEEEFGIEISDREAEKIITVQDAIDFVEVHAG